MMPMNSYESDDVMMMRIMVKMLGKLLPDFASIWSFLSVFTQLRIYDYLLDTQYFRTQLYSVSLVPLFLLFVSLCLHCFH